MLAAAASCVSTLSVCPAAIAGPPLLANSPINILGPSGYPVRNDNGSSPAYLGAGNGTTRPEMYTAYHPGNLGSSVPIQPGESTILTNLETGLYCQLRGLPTNSSQLGMFCDQPTPATATVMTYTGKCWQGSVSLKCGWTVLQQEKGVRSVQVKSLWVPVVVLVYVVVATSFTTNRLMVLVALVV